MKKWRIATPTFVLMILTLIGTYFHNGNLLRFGVAGLAGYSFLAIFVTGLALALQGTAALSRANRILFAYRTCPDARDFDLLYGAQLKLAIYFVGNTFSIHNINYLNLNQLDKTC